jgi:hypothetical protein
MKDDPIVQNVREIRDAYAAEFNYDLNALYEDIKKQEQANQKPHHRLTPKRIACFSVAEIRNRTIPTLPTHSSLHKLSWEKHRPYTEF